MKMRKTFSAAAIVAVLACSAAHAQVLGGSVGGAVNGALGGGLHNQSVLGNGNVNGTLGGELDSGSMLQRTRGTVDETARQTSRRARNAGTKVRNRAESSVAAAHDTSANVASETATEAAASHSSAIEPANLDGTPKLDKITSDVNGSASGNASASRRGVVAEAATDASAAASVDAKKQDEKQE